VLSENAMELPAWFLPGERSAFTASELELGFNTGIPG
jgi:hypothetical protein